MNIMITGGGTGGHIYPGLAVSQSLIEQGHHVYWGGRSYGMEKDLTEGLPYLSFWAMPLRSKNIWRQISAIFLLLGSMMMGLWYLKRHGIDRVFTLGGYVSVAPALAAYVMGVPVVCFEQNTKVGLANRVIARLATTCLSGLRCEDPRFKQVGNPVRQSIRDCQTHDSAKNLLIVGGSLGAGFLSQTLLPVILASFPGISVTCITGRGAQPKDHQSLISTYPHLKLIEYMDDIEQLYAHSSLVITRAGAMAVSEITLLGLRALFVPLPKSADNHQWHNAKSVQCEGIVVEHESVDHIIDHMKLWQSGLWPKPQPKDNHALQAITACLID
ncbi:glycosyltransferase [Gammaproteobacteria bacterium]|nr:glycosyltransferase [Gammaproteobacteria bacterium]